MFQLIAGMYQDPQFRIKMDSQCSEYKSQESVIRQGCPLSPFLFTLLMSAMFKDIKTKLNTPKQREPLPGIEFAEILCADDTLLFGTHTHTINKLLHAIQAESRCYNMSLNYDKCINPTLKQGTSSVKYLDGTLVPRKHEATYLGSLLTDTVDNHREVCNRIAEATVTCNRLKFFWNRAQNTVKWKLRVFDSILKSKVFYGLECIQLTQSDLNKLNAFQMKGLRRILRIPPTRIHRRYTNQKVLDILQADHHHLIEKFSLTWMTRKVKLLGHILRTDSKDPMKQVMLDPSTNRPRPEYRRPGKPRASWLLETIKDACPLLGRSESYDDTNNEHRQYVVQQAQTR